MRDVNETQIPAASAFATCPKCGTRFRFRPEGSLPPELGKSPENLSARPGNDESAEDIWESMDKLRSDWEKVDGQETREGQCGPEGEAGRTQEARRPSTQEARGRVPLYATTGSVPWEYKKGFLNPLMLFRTVWLAFTRIPQFFGGINPCSSILPAWVFMLVLRLTEFAASLYGLRQLLLMPDGNSQTPAIIPILQQPLPILLGQAAVVVSLTQLAGAVIIYYAIRTRQPQKASFRLVFKVMAYAQVAALFSLVPGPGGVFLRVIASLSLLVLGIRYAFRFNWQQTIISLAPYFILGLLFWGMSAQISSGLLRG